VCSAGGKLAGKTKLYKAFYLAHLFYAELDALRLDLVVASRG
jgi:hypothetical protein